MDGFPMIQTTEVTVEEQMKYIYSLPRRPDYVIVLHVKILQVLLLTPAPFKSIFFPPRCKM